MMARPALGALLLGLSGMACGDDDGGNDTGGNTEQPPMPATEGPMPNPTSDATSVAPMIPPDTTTTGESADTGTSTEGGTEIPPMVPPTTDSSGSDSGGGGDSSTGPIPPMPPPDGGAAPDEQEI